MLSWARVAKARHTGRERGDRVAREVRALLNKLTPTNFEKLSERLLAVELRGPDDMRVVVEEVVGRAQNLLFTGLFADLCCAVSDRMPSFDAFPSSGRRGHRHELFTFRELLLAALEQDLDAVRCGTVFSGDRRRLLGCAHLLGHLFNRGYVSSELMMAHLSSFVEGAEDTHPEAVECCCKLLGTAGKLLEASSEATRAWTKEILQRLSCVADGLLRRGLVRVSLNPSSLTCEHPRQLTHM